MILIRNLCTTLLLLSGQLIYAQSNWQPNKEELAGPLKFLASPLLEGRQTGTRGCMIAAEYIATTMEQYGLLPAGEAGWFQDYDYKGLTARNVIGMIKGTDTTNYVILTAHYDHLGMRNDSIFVGADDNASGVSGMLALAKFWRHQHQLPSCNLIFVAISAEETEILGSLHFVENFAPGIESVLLNMNFDMIARSDPKDTLCNILEIGILKERTDYKEMLERLNASSNTPFVLDFWESDGNGGSDYKHFAANGIPIIAFFTGLNGDYHTPADTPDKIDWNKMIRVLELANKCLVDFFDRIKSDRTEAH